MNEIWRDIPGYEGEYAVSNRGEIKSVSRYIRKNRWNTKVFTEEKILKSNVDKRGKGYKVISLSREGKKKTHSVHRIVAYAFLNLPTNLQVNHLNGDTRDNRVKNLEVCDAKRNRQHAYETGLQIGIRGEENHYSKLTRDQVSQIRKLLDNTDRKLAQKFKVHYSTINRIRNNKTWVEYD